MNVAEAYKIVVKTLIDKHFEDGCVAPRKYCPVCDALEVVIENHLISLPKKEFKIGWASESPMLDGM